MPQTGRIISIRYRLHFLTLVSMVYSCSHKCTKTKKIKIAWQQTIYRWKGIQKIYTYDKTINKSNMWHEGKHVSFPNWLSINFWENPLRKMAEAHPAKIMKESAWTPIVHTIVATSPFYWSKMSWAFKVFQVRQNFASNLKFHKLYPLPCQVLDLSIV